MVAKLVAHIIATGMPSWMSRNQLMAIYILGAFVMKVTNQEMSTSVLFIYRFNQMFIIREGFSDTVRLCLSVYMYVYE